MLEIKTIWGELVSSSLFDDNVNEALAEGWELVRREVLTPRQVATAPTLLYAELERIIEPEEEEEPEDGSVWVVSRNPSAPYRCNACGHSTTTPDSRCPGCGRPMVSYR